MGTPSVFVACPECGYAVNITDETAMIVESAVSANQQLRAEVERLRAENDRLRERIEAVLFDNEQLCQDMIILENSLGGEA